MYYLSGDWEKIEDPPTARDTVDRVVAALRPEDQRFRWHERGGGERSGHARRVMIDVTEVASRDLSFYPGWTLLRLACVLSGSGLDQLYDRAWAFVLYKPAEEGEQKGPVQARLLNGDASVIHGLNQLGELSLDSSIERCKDYLRFFTAFIRGEDGPFLLIEPTAEGEVKLAWEEVGPGGSGLLPSFGDRLEEDRRYLGWKHHDLFESAPGDETLKAIALKYLSSEEKRAKVREEAFIDPLVERPAADDAEASATAGWYPWQFAATVLYGVDLFNAIFRLTENGMVRMVDDHPLVPDLPVRRHVFEDGLVVRLRPREVIDGAEYASQLKAIYGDRPADAAEPPRLSNVRVSGDLDLEGVTFTRPLGLMDIEIIGDLILDESSSDRSLRIEKSKVRGVVSARNASCEGSFSLSRTDIHGITKRPLGGLDKPALLLNGARIIRNLNMQRTQVRGPVEARDLRLEGSARFGGLSIKVRDPYEMRAGLDLSGARIGQSLELSSPTSSLEGQARRPKAPSTDITGPVDLSRAHIGDINAVALKTSSIYSIERHATEDDKKRHSENAPQNEGTKIVLITVRDEDSKTVTTEPRLAVRHMFAHLELTDATISGAVQCDTPRHHDGSDQGSDARTTIDGSLLANRASVEGLVSLDGALVKGYLFLEAAHLKSGLRAMPAIARNGEVATEIHADFRFMLGRAEGPLFLIGTSVNGHFQIGEAVIAGGVKYLTRERSPCRASVGGNFLAVGAKLSGLLHLDGLHIAGDLALRGSNLGGGLLANPVTSVRDDREEIVCPEIAGISDLSECTFHGKLALHGARMRKSANLSSLRTNQPVTFSPVRDRRTIVTGNLGLRGAQIDSSLDLGGVLVEGHEEADRFGKGDLIASNARVVGMLSATPAGPFRCEVKGDVHLSGIWAESDIEFSGARIDGIVQLFTGKTGRLRFGPATILDGQGDESKCNVLVQHCALGGLMIHQATISGLDLLGAEIGKNDFMDASLEILASRISGNLNLSGDRPERRLRHSLDTDRTCLWKLSQCGETRDVVKQSDLRAIVKGRVVLKFLTIEGSVDLSNADVDGSIELDHCQIVGGDLSARAWAVREVHDVAMRLTCRNLDLTLTRVDGDADFKGLRIKACKGGASGDRGDFIARGAEFRGRLEFHDSDTRTSTPSAEAVIEGKLDLTAATVTRLIISGNHFQGEEEDAVLDRARIGRFDLREPFPHLVDLSHIEVGRWEVTATDFHKLLRQSWPFSRFTYRRIEQSLREQGDDRNAYRIFRAMQWRSITEGSFDRRARPWTWFPSLFEVVEERILKPRNAFSVRKGSWLRRGLGSAKRYLLLNLFSAVRIPFPYLAHVLFYQILCLGRPWRLAFLIAALLVLSGLVFGSPRNFNPSLDHLAAEPTLDARSHPGSWSTSNAVWATLRFSVPLAGVAMENRWDPRDTPIVCWEPPDLLGPPDGSSRPICGQSPALTGPWLSPADYAHLASFVNWVLWPLFLISVTGLIRRRGDASD